MRVTTRVESGLMRASFNFERLFPRLIKLYLARRLKEYKIRGTLSDYKLKVRRVKKYHYILELDLFLDSKGGEN